MGMEIQAVDIECPHGRTLRYAAQILDRGGVIIYPTDTIYGLGADIFNTKALERILKIKKASGQKLLSFICPDIQSVSQWAYISDSAFRIMRRITPGKFTFVLRSSGQVPKILLQKRQTVGIRIPDSPVAVGLVKALGRPLLSTSVPMGNDGFYSDPAEMARQFHHHVDLLLDGGILDNIPSTIVDFTGPSPLILREGAGDPTLVR